MPENLPDLFIEYDVIFEKLIIYQVEDGDEFAVANQDIAALYNERAVKLHVFRAVVLFLAVEVSLKLKNQRFRFLTNCMEGGRLRQ
jgi:hypothetical protein